MKIQKKPYKGILLVVSTLEWRKVEIRWGKAGCERQQIYNKSERQIGESKQLKEKNPQFKYAIVRDR